MRPNTVLIVLFCLILLFCFIPYKIKYNKTWINSFLSGVQQWVNTENRSCHIRRIAFYLINTSLYLSTVSKTAAKTFFILSHVYHIKGNMYSDDDESPEYNWVFVCVLALVPLDVGWGSRFRWGWRWLGLWLRRAIRSSEEERAPPAAQEAERISWHQEM